MARRGGRGGSALGKRDAGGGRAGWEDVESRAGREGRCQGAEEGRGRSEGACKEEERGGPGGEGGTGRRSGRRGTGTDVCCDGETDLVPGTFFLACFFWICWSRGRGRCQPLDSSPRAESCEGGLNGRQASGVGERPRRGGTEGEGNARRRQSRPCTCRRASCAPPPSGRRPRTPRSRPCLGGGKQRTGGGGVA